MPLGTEYLGGCCYDTVQEFLRDGYFEGMVDEAVSEARSTVAAIAAADDDAWEREQSHVRFAESGGHKPLNSLWHTRANGQPLDTEE